MEKLSGLWTNHSSMTGTGKQHVKNTNTQYTQLQACIHQAGFSHPCYMMRYLPSEPQFSWVSVPESNPHATLNQGFGSLSLKGCLSNSSAEEV